jgi:hypothetical protein
MADLNNGANLYFYRNVTDEDLRHPEVLFSHGSYPLSTSLAYANDVLFFGFIK